MKSFTSFITEYTKPMYATVVQGVANADYLELFNELKGAAGKNQYKIYVVENSLIEATSNLKYFRKQFPTHARSIVPCGDGMYESILSEAVEQRFTEITFMTSSTINLVESSQIKQKTLFRTSIPSTVSMIEFAEANDFISFTQHVTEHLCSGDTRRMFNDIRISLGLEEKKEFKQELSFKPVSKTREAFVEGTLFNLYETVVIKETGETGRLVNLGSNFVVVEIDGKKSRHWIDAVEPVSEAMSTKKTVQAAVEWGSKMVRLPDEGTDAAVKHAMKTVPQGRIQSFKSKINKDKK